FGIFYGRNSQRNDNQTAMLALSYGQAQSQDSGRLADEKSEASKQVQGAPRHVKKKKAQFKFKSTKRVARKSAAKSKAKKGYNIPSLTGREVSAQARLEKLTEQYEAEGLSRPEARSRSRAEMRANNTRDWRKG